MSAFHRAVRAIVPLKIAISGASGTGKTTAAIRLTRGLVGPTAPIAFCDTENGSASLYCDITPFDVMNMEPPYATEKFTQAIDAAVQGGYKALIIDSAAHAWLQVLQDKEALDARGGNNWTNWAGFTKKWEILLAAIRNAPIHIVLCVRSKEKHEMNDAKKVVKAGVGAQIREGFSYEVTTMFDIGQDHNAKAEKDRTRLFDGLLEPITEATGRKLAAWLSEGNAPEPERAPQISEKETQAQLGQMVQDRAAQQEETSQEAADFVDGVDRPRVTITADQWQELTGWQTAANISGSQLLQYCQKKSWLPAAAQGLNQLAPEGFDLLKLHLSEAKRGAFRAHLDSHFPTVTPTVPTTTAKGRKPKAA